jgi:hypothetical protein
MFIIKDDSPIPAIETEIKRVQSLLQDLKRASVGRHPNSRTLVKAPVLDNWQMAYRPEPCLVGTMHDHPHVTDGHLGMTSGVWLLAPTIGYARTLSRVYVLGRQLPSQNTLS